MTLRLEELCAASRAASEAVSGAVDLRIEDCPAKVEPSRNVVCGVCPAEYCLVAGWT